MRATRAVRKTEGTHTLLKLHTDIRTMVKACNEFAVKIIHDAYRIPRMKKTLSNYYYTRQVRQKYRKTFKKNTLWKQQKIIISSTDENWLVFFFLFMMIIFVGLFCNQRFVPCRMCTRIFANSHLLLLLFISSLFLLNSCLMFLTTFYRNETKRNKNKKR